MLHAVPTEDHHKLGGDLALNARRAMVPTPSRIEWYRQRLKVMHPTELAHRVTQQVGLCWFRLSQGVTESSEETFSIKDISGYAFCRSEDPVLPELPWVDHIDPLTRDRLLAGGLDTPDSEWRWQPNPDIWHLAPDTERLWPRKLSSFIPYRAGNPYGDVRLAWEPSRLQQLVGLALLARRGDPSTASRAVVLLEAQLWGWVQANPVLQGIHYISAMECGLRILAASYAVDLARHMLTDRRRTWTAYLRLVRGHAAFILRKLSKHSSSGNHTIAEAVGLLYAGCLLAECPDATGWKEQGLQLLETQAPRQILPDGGGAEQGFAYLVFVADLIGLAIRLLDHRGEPPSMELCRAFTRARGTLRLLADRPEDVPPIGDADGGVALSRFLALLWSEPHRREESRPPVTILEDSGYSIISSAQGRHGFLMFDHGPLGMPPCFGHGHADALSVVFRYGGKDVLLDPGTGTYNGDPAWRTYFRSTRAHNTVTVDGLDQAEQTGTFLWSKPYEGRLVRQAELPGGGVILLATHDGYVTQTGVRHWRAVLYQPPAFWLVWDQLVGDGVHRLELNWHLGTDPYPQADGYRLLISGATVGLRIEGGLPHVHRGDLFPIHGWRSIRYGQREPISTLRTAVTTTLPHEFLTTIWLEGHPISGKPAEEILHDVRQWSLDACTS